MEKKQHHNEESTTRQSNGGIPQQAPGQQVPAGATANEKSASGPQHNNEQHSESSLPQNDNETLGTP